MPGEVLVTQAEQVYSGSGGVGDPLSWPRLMVTVTSGWSMFAFVAVPPQATISTLNRKRRSIAPHLRERDKEVAVFHCFHICNRIYLVSPLSNLNISDSIAQEYWWAVFSMFICHESTIPG